MMENTTVLHSIPPVWDTDSAVLILGSFPSVKSRAEVFFYGHPKNRFWRVLALVFEDALPETIEEKTAFLRRHRIALWDVVAACRITGSADSSIRAVQANDISEILRGAPIRQIFVHGNTAAALYRKHMQPCVGRTAHLLPSTSPANAAWSLARLCDAWAAVRAAAMEENRENDENGIEHKKFECCVREE